MWKRRWNTSTPTKSILLINRASNCPLQNLKSCMHVSAKVSGKSSNQMNTWNFSNTTSCQTSSTSSIKSKKSTQAEINLSLHRKRILMMFGLVIVFRWILTRMGTLKVSKSDQRLHSWLGPMIQNLQKELLRQSTSWIDYYLIRLSTNWLTRIKKLGSSQKRIKVMYNQRTMIVSYYLKFCKTMLLTLLSEKSRKRRAISN